MVVMSATFIPDATMVALMSPATRILSNAITIPITVPRNPNDGAIVMHSYIHEHPLSRLAVCTAPYDTTERSMSSMLSFMRNSP